MRIVFAAILVVVTASAAFAERRVALVFGADRYEAIRPLANAVNDARAVEEALDALGFEVFSEANRDLRRMRRALEDFAEDAAGADVALIFFAGHGVEIAGENRLLPTDADASSLEALEASSLPLEALRRTAAEVADIALIVLDACRNDPFGVSSDPQGRGAKALRLPATVKPGLGRLGRAENTLFAFSAAPGETAADGKGNNSPFTTALAKYLGTDGLEIRSVLTLVQQEVYERSRGAQLPYVESGLPALFFASQASGELPERERLLLAMADVSPQMREDVERIASDAGMPLAPLYGALIGGDIAGLNREERTEKLREAAASFAKVRDELRTLRSGDERVTALRRAAEEQLALGAFDGARAKLSEAANIDASSRETLKANYVERTLSEAATHYLNGGAAAAELKYQLAIADYEKAAALYAELEDRDVPAEDMHQEILALGALGSVYMTSGNVGASSGAFQAQLMVAKRRASSDPANTGWQLGLSIAYNNVGDARKAEGDLVSALAAYEAGLAIRERLSTTNSADTELQYGLSVSHERVGHVRMAQRDLAGALAAYEASLAIRKTLLKADPGNRTWQYGLMFGHNWIGDVQVLQRDFADALAAYEAGLAIGERLAAANPADGVLQHGLAAVLTRIGDVRLEQGDVAGAIAAYDAFFARADRLARADPGNVIFQRNLLVLHQRTGNLRMEQGDVSGALAAYVAGLVIAERLAKNDPNNSLSLHDLSLAHGKIGNTRAKQGDIAGAVAAYQAGLVIAERLAKADPDNGQWQGFLSAFYFKLAEVGGDPRANYRKALSVLESMARRGMRTPSDDLSPDLLRSKLEALDTLEAAE